MKTDCAEWREDLTAYLDGELPAARAGAVKHHIENCPACRTETARLEKAGRYLDHLAAPAADPSFASRFWRRVRREATAPRSATTRARPRWLLPVAIAAGVMAVLAVLFLPPRTRRPKKQDVEVQARLAPEDSAIVEELSTLAADDFDAARDLDLLERLDVVRGLDEEEIDAAGEM
ncbi:MAG: zf-HC2 domain-containing protein [Planctomycetes bacterium]|nr:zf-HC2 domain-containing protein [Planctomycetota bacterium]